MGKQQMSNIYHYCFFSQGRRLKMMAQQLVLPIVGNSFSAYNLLKSGLVSYYYAVRIKLVILNSLLSTTYNSFLACSFFQGITITASPSQRTRQVKICRICWGEKPSARRSGHTRWSYFTVAFWIYSGERRKLMTLLTPLLRQFLAPFRTTSSLTSQMAMLLAQVHLPRATAAMPTPALTTRTSLPLNLSASRMTYLARTISMSHNLSPYNQCGKMSRSEMVAFILKPQCRMMSLLLSRRTIFWEEAHWALLLLLGLFWLPIMELIIQVEKGCVIPPKRQKIKTWKGYQLGMVQK